MQAGFATLFKGLENLNANKVIPEISDTWHVANMELKITVRTTTFWSSTFNERTSFLLGVSTIPQLVKCTLETALASLQRTQSVTLYRSKQTEHMLFAITLSKNLNSSLKESEVVTLHQLPLFPITDEEPTAILSQQTVNENGCLDTSLTVYTPPK